MMVNVSKAIAPRVAPPPGSLRARLTVENVVGRLELARIGTENVASVWLGGKFRVPADGRVVLAGNGRAV